MGRVSADGGGVGRVLRVEERELLWQTTDGGELASKEWRRIQLAGTNEWQDDGGLAGKVDWRRLTRRWRIGRKSGLAEIDRPMVNWQ